MSAMHKKNARRLQASSESAITGSVLLFYFLVLARLGVRPAQGVPPRPAATPTWTDWAAKLVHRAFYLMLFAMPLLGLLTVYVSDSFGDIHKLGKPVSIVLVAIHVPAALFHPFIKRAGTLRRMLVPAGSQLSPLPAMPWHRGHVEAS